MQVTTCHKIPIHTAQKSITYMFTAMEVSSSFTTGIDQQQEIRIYKFGSMIECKVTYEGVPE
jgi:hypothetical protein